MKRRCRDGACLSIPLPAGAFEHGQAMELNDNIARAARLKSADEIAMR